MISLRVRQVPTAAIRQYCCADWVDPDRRPYVVGTTAFVPVRDGYSWEMDLPERCDRAVRGFQRLGDLVLFHGERPDSGAVQDAVRRCSPRGVLWVMGHEGNERLPRVEVLWGESGEVVHRECGLSYRLDPSQVMFSQGNREEKVRLAHLVQPDERVADLFAGIGYFVLGLARAGACVHAMEINPVAHGYLCRNVDENGLADRVQPECGDCRDLLRGIYDRLVLGHFDGPCFLEDALAHVRVGSRLHVHAIESRAGELGPDLARRAEAMGLPLTSSVRVIKKYAPGRLHTVHDLVIT